jgi:hypothetical protein
LQNCTHRDGRQGRPFFYVEFLSEDAAAGDMQLHLSNRRRPAVVTALRAKLNWFPFTRFAPE